MMGRSHVTVGACGGLVVATVTGATLPVAAACAVVAGGAALLPDFDHHNSSVAHSLGPVTRVLARTVEKVSGGHRHATHSLLCCALIGLGVGAATIRWGEWAIGAVAFLCAALAVHTFARGAHPVTIGVIALAAAAGLSQVIPAGSGQLGLVVGVGCLFHLVADAPTQGPFPWFWPLPWRWAAGLVHTGGMGEKLIVGAAVLASAAFTYTRFV